MTPKEFKDIRGAIGVSQAELARRLGVDPMTVSRWERKVVSIPNPVEKLMKVWVKEGCGARRKR